MTYVDDVSGDVFGSSESGFLVSGYWSNLAKTYEALNATSENPSEMSAMSKSKKLKKRSYSFSVSESSSTS